MSNEVTTMPNALAILNGAQTETETKLMEEKLTSANFLPTLAIAAGTSAAVTDKQIAFPGDFVIGGSSKVGKTVAVVPVTWRLRAREWDNDKNKYGDSAFYCKDLGPNMSGYNAFLKKVRPRSVDVTEGMEFLMYIPEKNVFCTYFIKNTQRDAIEPLSAFRGRLATLEAIPKKGKRGPYYLTEVRLENRALSFSTLNLPGTTIEKDIVVDPEHLQKAVELFLKPMTVTADDSADLNN